MRFFIMLFGFIAVGIVLWAAFLFPKRYPHLPDWEAKIVAVIGLLPLGLFVYGVSYEHDPAVVDDLYGQSAIAAYVFAYFPFVYLWHKRLLDREERAKKQAKEREYEHKQELASFQRPPPEEFMRQLKAAIAPIQTTAAIKEAFLKGAPRFYENALIPRESREKQQTFVEDTANLLAERFATFVGEYRPPPKPSGPNFQGVSENRRYDEDIAAKIGMMAKMGAMRDEYAQFHTDTFQELFELTATLPFVVKDQSRFEHTWILGPQGSGKTQLMQYLITEDIKRDCAVMVIDSQGDLVKNVSSLADIQDRLILVEPGAVAINPFDFKGDHALELLTYVFSALGDTFTPKQETLYRYCIRLLQASPGATLMSFLKLLEKNGLQHFLTHVAGLSEPARLFFENQFDDPKQYAETKQEVARRLMLLLENDQFRAMFSSPETRLDLGRELDARKVIVVDTSKKMLGKAQSALMGRFFIALLLMASHQRASQKERTPTFVYVDEAHEYLADDTVADILDQARKMKIGMHLANQRSAQVSNPNMLDALLTTSVKFVHTDNDRDTHLLARPLKTTPEEIAALPDRVFHLFVRNGFSTPVKVPFFVMEAMEHVERDELRARMREQYAPITRPTATPSPPVVDPERPAEKVSTDPEGDTAPKRW